MNLIIMFLILLGGFFIIGLVAAVCEQHKSHDVPTDDEEDDYPDAQPRIVVSQEVPSVFDTFSSKK